MNRYFHEAGEGGVAAGEVGHAGMSLLCTDAGNFFDRAYITHPNFINVNVKKYKMSLQLEEIWQFSKISRPWEFQLACKAGAKSVSKKSVYSSSLSVLTTLSPTLTLEIREFKSQLGGETNLKRKKTTVKLILSFLPELPLG